MNCHGSRQRALRCAGIALALVLLPAIAWPLPPGESEWRFSHHVELGTGSATVYDTQSGRRIVSIADIHGARDEFISILAEVGLVDAELNWAGGDTIFVQTGDIADRGPEVRACLDLLMRLQDEAPEAGGEVIVVFGNHEAMNLVDFFRDGTPEDFAAFVDEGSEERQQKAYEDWVEMRQKRAEDLDLARPRFTSDDKGTWMEDHPLGYFERMDAFGPDGYYGRWLRELPTAVRLDNLLFMHAGLSPEFADMTPEEMNAKVWEELERFDDAKEKMVDEGLITPYADLVDIITGADLRLVHMLNRYPPEGERRPSAKEQELARTLSWLLEYQDWQMLTRDGLLWFRGLAQWPEAEHADDVAGILEKQDIDHIIVGHSVQGDGHIGVRFDGAVFLNDTGMLASVYEGRPSALELEDGVFTAVYLGEREALFPEAAPSPTRPAARVPSVRPGIGVPLPLNSLGPGWQTPAATGRVWWAPDGSRLPFRDDDELIEFLRSAEIVGMERLEEGITGAHRLELEQGGIRARAIFHTVDLRRERATIEGRFFAVFRDSWRAQVAAYWLARLLDIDNVPPTVRREIDREEGSVQLWLENDGIMSNRDRVARGIQAPDLDSWLAQQWVMNVFDALVFNDDRHIGNTLVDAEWTLWLIDHTRAFQRDPTIRNPENLTHIERGLWKALRDLPDEAFRGALEPYLERDQVNAVLTRRDLIVEYFEALIEAVGEENVLYEFDRERLHR